MNILDKIESSHYVANEAQVEGLALEAYKIGLQSTRIDGTYLRVLIAGCQAKLGPVRRGRSPSAESQLAVIEETHGRFYAAVLRGVTTPDIAADPTQAGPESQRRALERNRRSGFARSAKSTLAAYARAGGDVRILVVDEVTKGSLRAATAPATLGSTDRVSTAQRSLLAALGRQAKVDPGGTRETIEQVMEELQKVLDSLDDEGDHGATTTVASRAHARTRAGAPMLHRPVAA